MNRRAVDLITIQTVAAPEAVDLVLETTLLSFEPPELHLTAGQ